MKKKVVCIILVGMFCMLLCSCAAEHVVNDVVDQVSNVAQADDENILAVKGGTNSNYPEVTYGDAFEAFFGMPTWKYFKGTQEGPDEDGDGQPDYTLDNIDVVEFTGTCVYSGVEVKALIQFTLDKEAGTFEASYLSFNKVPQNTLMLYGLVETVFENYLENDEPIGDNDVVVDEYDDSALMYAGLYEGYGGYSIAFSAYTSIEGDEIGVAEIYYNDELVSTQAVSICRDKGDWVDDDYDQFYVMHCDGYDEYLGFYEYEGIMMLDYNGPTKNCDILELAEHFES